MTRSSVAGMTSLMLTFAVGGCSSARMDVPAELEAVEEMPVEGRGGWRASQRAAFGPYEAADVDRSWTKGRGWSVGLGGVSGGSNRAAQEYQFRFLENGEERGTVRCAASGSRGTVRTVVDIDLAAGEMLECRPDLAPEAREPAWDLSLSATRDRHLEGFLRIGEARYSVASTGPGGKYAPANPFGFEIRDGDRVVAAVEVVNEGSVRLAPELSAERRSAMAAAAAGLLLWERLETD